MAEVLFEIPEWLDYADYDNYPTQANPTTNADFINYSRNQNKLVGALTSAFLWQPNTNFIAGKIIVSPNMPEGMEAVALTGGYTGTVEPAWESDTAEYQDGGVKWQLRHQHWSKDVEQITDLTTGATNRLPNTSYAVGNVVYDKSNLSVALKCTRAGTTSNTKLDISTVSVGESVEDGSVVWEVIPRYEEVHKLADYPLRNTEYALNAVVACPYHVEFLLKCTQAGRTSEDALDTTGATKGQVLEDGGVKWEVIAKAVIDTRVTGGIINIIFADGTVKEIKPYSDMNDYIIESYRNGTEWYEVYKSGKVRQGGKCAAGQQITSITLHKPFANTNYSVFSAAAGDGTYYAGRNYVATNKTTTNFNCAQGYNTGTSAANHWDGANYWVAEGQGA